jgi:RimJ/RimL family protein N-acetyltransferase
MACHAAISWATSTFGSHSIDAYIEPGNLESIRLILRLRFAPTGESKEGADRYLLITRKKNHPTFG